MNVDMSDLVKLASVGAGVGTALAAVRPFALFFFQRWLLGQDKREAVIERVAVEQGAITRSIERVIGVLEAQHKVQERTEKRLDRIEGKLGIPTTASDIPPPLPSVRPRDSITNETGGTPPLPTVEHRPPAPDPSRPRTVAEAR